ncbi:uncharacterized protein LOC107260950 [Ricinus communis]|uniref:uncharacterized protein LOC107260950 n=1 Tax=Ricinus communis TaxID=3988 RepID=UPI00201AA47D|nr:uncharacterized protein LOC107260950 [Ricinus communis]
MGDKVFLKISPWKGVLRFGKRGKLSPKYIGLFEVIERIGPVAYRLVLLLELSQIHDVFHVTMLRRYCMTRRANLDLVDPLPEPDRSLRQLRKRLNIEKEEIQMVDVVAGGSLRSKTPEQA